MDNVQNKGIRMVIKLNFWKKVKYKLLRLFGFKVYAIQTVKVQVDPGKIFELDLYQEGSNDIHLKFSGTGNIQKVQGIIKLENNNPIEIEILFNESFIVYETILEDKISIK